MSVWVLHDGGLGGEVEQIIYEAMGIARPIRKVANMLERLSSLDLLGMQPDALVLAVGNPQSVTELIASRELLQGLRLYMIIGSACKGLEARIRQLRPRTLLCAGQTQELLGVLSALAEARAEKAHKV